MEDLKRVKSEIEGLLKLYSKCLTKVKAALAPSPGDDLTSFKKEKETMEDHLATLSKSILADITKTRDKLNSKVGSIFQGITAKNDPPPKAKDISEFKVVGELDSSLESTFILVNDNFQLWGKSPSSSLLKSEDEPKIDWPSL